MLTVAEVASKIAEDLVKAAILPLDRRRARRVRENAVKTSTGIEATISHAGSNPARQHQFKERRKLR